MKSERSAGRIIGLLLLAHLVTGLILPYVLLGPLTGAPARFLETAAPMALQVRTNVFVLFVGGALSVAISFAAWPSIRERSGAIGLWLLALAAINFTLQIVENSHWLTMLSVSQAYAEAGAAGAAAFQPLGIVVRSAWKWAHYSHIFVVVAWLFTFYCVLYQGALVPRALAASGMATSILHVAGITFPAFAGFRMPNQELFGMPLGLVNLVLSIWLMTTGFRRSSS